MRGGCTSGGRPSWKRRAEDAERALRRASGALRLSQELYRVLQQSPGPATLPDQVCEALVEAGCLAAAWWMAGQLVSRSRADTTAVSPARLEDWLRSWGEVDTELVAAAVPLDGLFAAADTARPRHLLLPLREGDQCRGVVAVMFDDDAGPEAAAVVEQAMASAAIAMASQGDCSPCGGASRPLHAAEVAQLMSSIDHAVWALTPRDGRWVYLNEAFERLCGRPAAEFMRDKRLWRQVVHPDDLAGLVKRVLRSPVSPGAGEVLRVLRPDGSVRWVETRTIPTRDAGCLTVQLIGVATDITDRIRHEARVEQLATRDSLTGLFNRHGLVNRASQALAIARGGHGGLAFGVLSLDGLRFINSGLGHEAGDALLAAVARRLCDVVRTGDVLARLGGDEFALLSVEATGPEKAAALGNRLLASFASPFAVGEHELHLSASVGMAVWPEDGDDTTTLLQHAHSALHSAKREGGACCRLYTHRMSVDAAERIRLDQALRVALERGEFELYYQPQIDLCSGAVIGAEALIRWHHAELSWVSPGRFIPLAEETGLIVPLGEWVLRTACAQMVAWQRAGHAPQRVAVNLSARQLWQGRVVQTVARVLGETGLSPASLELEITESVVIRDGAEAVQVLSALRALGVCLALDDFGTGYSSLYHLRSLPLNKLKIDRSFVQDLATRPDMAVLVRQIVQIGHAFGLRVVAEGVESREVVDFLAGASCDEAQGFYFGQPLPAHDFEALLRRQARPFPVPAVQA